MGDVDGFARGGGDLAAMNAAGSTHGTRKIRTEHLRHFRRRSVFASRGAVGLVVVLVLLSGVARAQIWVSSPALLNTNGNADAEDDEYPQVATDGAGTWVALWVVDWGLSVFVARSTDNAASWTAPVLLNSTSDAGYAWWPQLATDGAGTWVAMWAGETFWGLNVFVTRSTDNGASWTTPALLNTNGTADLGHDMRPQVTTDRAGNWVAVWTREIVTFNGAVDWDWNVFVVRSTDNGASWTAPALLDAKSGDLPQVATDGAGNWVAVWISIEQLDGATGSDTDIFVARSTDNGASWTAPALLNTNGTTDTGEDLFPQVTTDGAGNWVAVWVSGEDLNGTAGTDWDIFVARSTDNGASWTAPALLNANGTTDTGDDIVTQVATDGAGNWIAAFGSENGASVDIFVARSTDNGASWTAPVPLNTNRNADDGWDGPPRVATDGAGHWVAVWDSTKNLNGTAGTDSDIFVARFSLGSNSTAGMPAFGKLAVALLVLSISALYVRRIHIRRT
jgi:hypothetical protein